MASISGAHMIVYSANADADRAFIRDVLGFPHVDVGQGWLIFALPASEIAVHPGEKSSHEIYLMVDDVAAFVARMDERGVRCTPPQNQGWGVLTQLTLPGGGQLGVYQPRHARPEWPERRARKAVKSRKTVTTRKPAKRRVATKAAKPARRKRRGTKR
jgi:catechol 2,3-dioxygenase-like lactoylglutathione lyase family enzyme